MFNKKLLGLAIGATLLTTAHNSFAGTGSATANYEITLGSACTVTATGQVFPSQLTGATADLLNTAAGTVSVTCNPGVLYDWGINAGANWNAPPVGMYRKMNSAVTGQNIPYQLRYNGMFIGDDGLQMKDPSYISTTMGWGLMSAQMISGPMAGTGMVQTYSLTSDVLLSTGGPMGYPAGTYTDTVTVVVAFL